MKVVSINTPSPHFGAINYKVAKGSEKDLQEVKDFFSHYMFESSVGSLYEGLIKLAGKEKKELKEIFEQAISKHSETKDILQSLKDSYFKKRCKKNYYKFL